MPKRAELAHAEKLAAAKMSRHEARTRLHISYERWRQPRDGANG